MQTRFFAFVLLSCFVFVFVHADVEIGYFIDSNCTESVFLAEWGEADEECVTVVIDAVDAVLDAISGSDFHCYQEEFCFNMYVGEFSCSSAPVVGYASTNCTAPTGDFPYYSKIISGTDQCTEAPEGFTCAAPYEDEEQIIVPRDLSIIVFLCGVVFCEFIAIIRAIMLYRRGPKTDMELLSSDDSSMLDDLDLSVDLKDLDDLADF